MRRPRPTSDAYLRLHALSHRLVAPERPSTSTASSATCPTVAWTNAGPMHPDDATPPAAVPRARRHPGAGPRQVPAPAGLRDPARRADRGRVARAPRRLPLPRHDGHARGIRELQRGHARRIDGRGPHLAGRRGRRRQRHRRRRVHHGHALGRRRAQVSIGARTLLGANAGVGISLGDDCVVEAGLYVTAGSKIVLADEPPRARRRARRRQGRASCPGATASCSGATRSPARSRPSAAAGVGRHAQRGAARVRSRHAANRSRATGDEGVR